MGLVVGGVLLKLLPEEALREVRAPAPKLDQAEVVVEDGEGGVELERLAVLRPPPPRDPLSCAARSRG